MGPLPRLYCHFGRGVVAVAYRSAPLNAFEEAVVARASRYVATAFRGRAQYEHREASTLDGVLALASELRDGSRGVVIYAVTDEGTQAVVGTWAPDR